MKKLKWIIIILLLICLIFILKHINTNNKSIKKNNKTNLNKNIKERQEKEEETNLYKDENPVKVGLYQNGKLINELTTDIINKKDIASFDVYFTNIPSLDSTNTKDNFNKYYNTYEECEKYKIGFYISFNTNDKLIEGTILGPNNMYILSPYIFNYLYDDIHVQDGSWYSHVEEQDVTDNTVYSSIKLYAADKTEEITSPITLTVFTYDGKDDFDEKGYYRGNSKYTITIKKN